MSQTLRLATGLSAFIGFLAVSQAHGLALPPPGDINTIAGGGLTGDGAPALQANLPQPRGVVSDAAGDLFFTSGCQVWKLNAATDRVNVIAGTGQCGFNGDGAALNAWLNFPDGIALDGAGNVYVADSFNNRIRKIDTAGNITTVAGRGGSGFGGDGGLATNAFLSTPRGVFIDGLGNVYIADTGNNRIRMVRASDDKIFTVAGNGGSFPSCGAGLAPTSVALVQPWAVVKDATGNFYFSEDSRICEATTSNATIRIAGTGVSGFSGDDGPAASAQIYSPRGLGFDSSGNIFFADSGNGRLREINVAGIISTAASGLNSPDGVAAASTGIVFFADTLDNKIDEFNPITKQVSVAAGGETPVDGIPATQSILADPLAVYMAAGGNILIADTEDQKIRKVDSSGIITTIAGNGGAGFSGDDGPATQASLNLPSGIVEDSLGDIYIADSQNSVIREVNTAGIITTVAGTPGVQGCSGDGGPAVNSQLRLPMQNGVVTGVAFMSLSNGDLIFSDTGNSRVRYIRQSDHTIHTLLGSASLNCGETPLINFSLGLPRGLSLDQSGDLLIADSFDNRIVEISSVAIASIIAGSGSPGYFGDGDFALEAKINEPAAIAVDGSGQVFISDTNNQRIRKVSLDGIITTVVGTGQSFPFGTGDGGPALQAHLYNPEGIAVDAGGNVYLADSGDNRIRAVGAPVEGFLDVTPPGIITGLSAAPGSSVGSINLDWTATGNDGAVGTTSHYIVKYATYGITDQSSFQGAATYAPALSKIPQPAGSPESLQISGLTPSVTYFVSVEATDQSGNLGGFPGSVFAVAPSAVNHPPNAPILIFPVSTALDFSTPTFRWTGNDPDPGDALTFNLTLSTVPDFSTVFLSSSGIVGTPQAGAFAGSFTAPSSLPEGVYFWEVTVFDGSLLGPASSATFTVDLTSPSIAIVEPINGSTVSTEASPLFVSTYTDNLSGIDTVGIRLFLDTSDVSALAAISASSTVFTPIALSPGKDPHVFTLIVPDRAGNTAVLSSTFDAIDVTSPTIVSTGLPSGFFSAWVNTATAISPIPIHFFDAGGSHLSRFEIQMTTDAAGLGTPAPTFATVLSSADFGAATDAFTSDWAFPQSVFDLMPEGTDYATIRVFDQAGNFMVALSTFAVLKDTTPPVVPSDNLWLGNNIGAGGPPAIAGGSIALIQWCTAANQPAPCTLASVATDTLSGFSPNPVSLFYSTDAGTDFVLISSGLANTGTFSWTTPAVNSTQTLVKIAYADRAGNTAFDESNGVFTIGSPNLVLNTASQISFKTKGPNHSRHQVAIATPDVSRRLRIDPSSLP